ncbi:hypothetical protein LZP69_00195 [Shewanella sp. AS1]|uniref:hypothetical protein n=1 Tax=Shewanella sp. AS1 TaxID=2907626 RepID=UPI001F20B05E|nr:hypothetical protein [Shewanella sp. AS1]MCE9677610.1 hypothetical protein [Shewanella sp. AS1]
MRMLTLFLLGIVALIVMSPMHSPLLLQALMLLSVALVVINLYKAFDSHQPLQHGNDTAEEKHESPQQTGTKKGT